ncbi:MAG: ArnT family glycosyltransferase, partial [Candidatus Dormibacteraceae bacterium]
LMVLWLVAAAYALTRAIEADSSYWLLLSAFFVGCGFMTKMLEAWIVVPALALAFLFGSTTPMARRLVQLAGSGVVLVMSSFWWIALVDLWPGPKPYIGSSPNGTAFSLAIGYNGIERILPGRTVDNTDSVDGLLMGGMPGLLRFFNPQVGGQISWLLPLVLLTLIVGVVATVRHRGFERWLSPMQRAGWILWAGWLLTGWVLLSFAFGAFHPYLTAVLAPAVAAAAAAGLDRLWRSYREPTGWGWVLLPIGIVITTLWAVALVARDPAWNGWLGYVCLGLGVVTLGVLLALRASRVPRQSLNILVNLLILTTILLGPTTWSVATGFGPSHAFLGPHNPSAGPFVRPTVRDVPEKQRGILGPLQPPGPFDLLIGRLTPEQVHLLDYSEAHAGNARIALAVEEGALFSSPYQIATHHDDVIGMGGYMGSDPAPTIDQLATWKTQGELRFVLSNAPSSGKNVSDLDKLGGPVVAQRVRWVRTHCRIVPRSVYRNESAPSGVFDTLTLEALYDCG